MRRFLSATWPYWVGLVVFLATIVGHRSYSEKKTRNALAQHSRIFAPFLWNLERERAAQAAEIVMKVEGYASLRIEHPNGDAFFAADLDMTLSGLEEALRELRLIHTTVHGTILLHDREEIGRLSVVKVNQDVYFFAIVLSFLALIAFAAHMVTRNFAHRKELAEVHLKLETARRKDVEMALVEREKQLAEVRRLENLGRLASGLAHDFNNFLTVIICNTNLLQRKTKGEERHVFLLEGIADASDKASKLTRQLLSFAGRRKSNPRDLCLNDIVSDMSSMLSHMLGDDIGLEKKLEPDLWTIKADASQIEQVIMNLVVNARDAMQGGGRICLETRNDCGRSERLSNQIQSQCVTLKIADNGEGMDEEIQRRAFEPFFTTKKASGTGLGLATVRSIVEQCGGDIRLESQKGKGTTIEMFFPCSNGCVDVVQKPQISIPCEVRADRSASILVVEDQEAIRKVIAEALVEAGYTVAQAADGHEGLEAAFCASRPFDLLLTDVNMPGLSGIELGRRVKSHDPQTRVLCMSGHMRKTAEEAGQASFPILEKPFAISQLLETVERFLSDVGVDIDDEMEKKSDVASRQGDERRC